MLILSRRPGQKIIVDQTIEIELLRIDHNQATIGITAPSNVAIYREEIWTKIQQAHDAEN